MRSSPAACARRSACSGTGVTMRPAHCAGPIACRPASASSSRMSRTRSSSYVHRAIEDVARARGVWTFAASADERSELERELALAFCARRIDGLIIVPAPERITATSHASATRASPLVFVDRPPAFLDADTVLSDNADATSRAILGLDSAAIAASGFSATGSSSVHGAGTHCRDIARRSSRSSIAEDASLVRADLSQIRRAPTRPSASCSRLADPPTALFTATEPDHDCDAPHAARARPSPVARASSASTTSSSLTCSSRPSQSSRRTPPRSGARPPSSCSRGSTATPRRRNGSSCQRR